MPELLPLDGNLLSSLLVAVAGLGILLLLGVLLRALVPVLRRFFIPAALLGGLVGLLLGPYALGWIPESITTTWSGIAGILITIVFAPMLMGGTTPEAE